MVVPEKILIVDDDPDIAEALVAILEDEGYQTAVARNGQEALDHLRASESVRPCVILLDLMMPVMDGHEFLVQQSNDDRLAQIPVLIVTAGSMTGPAAMPVRAVLSKPLRMESLLGLIERYC